MDKAQAELDALKRTEEDLKKGHQKLEEMVSRLDQEVVRNSCLLPSDNVLIGGQLFFLSPLFHFILNDVAVFMVSNSLRLTGTLSC